MEFGTRGNHGKNVTSRAVVGGSYVKENALVRILAGQTARDHQTTPKTVTHMNVRVNIGYIENHMYL
jgi:hypothetical protein